MERIEISNFDKNDYSVFTAELLKAEFNYTLLRNEEVNAFTLPAHEYQPDLIQVDSLKDGERSMDVVRVVVEIDSDFKSYPGKFKAIYKDYIKMVQPDVVIFISFKTEVSPALLELSRELKSLVKFIHVLNISWIDKTLNNHPAVLNKWSLNSAIDFFQNRTIFLAGHYFDGSTDKFDEFISEGKWINGHDRAFVDLVNSVNVGDIIIDKTYNNTKNDRTFIVSAIGVVNSNLMDGHTLGVSWHAFTPIQISLDVGYRYLDAIEEIQPSHTDVILNQIHKAHPDLKIHLAKMDEQKEYSLNQLIEERISSNGSFWWLQANPKKWNVDSYEIGSIQEYSTHNTGKNRRRIFDLFFKVNKGDILIIYESSPSRCIKALAEITKPATNKDGDVMQFRLLHFFERQTKWKELLDIEEFRSTSLAQNNQGSLFQIDKNVAHLIINTTELKSDLGNNVDSRKRDKIPFHNDIVAQEDKLGREPVAEAFVNLLKKDVFTEDMNHAFMVHLQGEWGAGKSTFLNLIKKHLNSEGDDWVVVDYNAWQNQHLIPPWWTFIDQIYRQSDDQLKMCRLRLKEKWRRIIWYSGWQKIVSFIFTLVFIGILFYYGNSILDFMVNAPEANSNIENVEKGITLGVFSKLFISIGSAIGLIYSFSKFIATPFFINSTDDATSFVRKSADPMSRIKSHFNKLVDDINSKEKKRQLAIFIDDIDRCNRDFIIQLLEGIQTLFKEKRVLYIVAGDKNWISTSFEKTYGDFATQQSSTHHNLGDLFLEKAFQLSLRMPNISDTSKEEYWSHILGITESEDEDQVEIEEVTSELKAEVEMELNTSEEDITAPEFIKKFEKKHNLSSNAASSLIIEKKNESDTEIKHLLKDLHSMVETNPRAIIRLANNYTMTRSTLIAERKSVNSEKLLRWLIIKDLYPKAVSELNSKTQKAFEQALEKGMTEQVIKEKFQQLISGNEKHKNDALTVEEMKTFEGL